MNKLFTFGCSFTAGNGCLIDEQYRNKYKKNEEDLTWTEHLSKELGLELFNFGMGEYSNDKILDTLITNFEKIGKDDIVILEMSFHHRFDIPNKNDNFLITIAPNPSNLLVNEYHGSEVDHITFVSTLMESPLFRKRNQERFNFMRDILLKLKNVSKCLIWDVETEIDRFQKIAEATDLEIIDYHWSYKGHLDFSIEIMKRLNKII